MASVVAGIYEIQEPVGAGGGGIVYTGYHLRLDKRIVLKADRRRLGTKTEILRREVDMLKGLSHTYIPQVYDFVQEDGVVYTVMDFIDGESLDHLLKRGQIPAQPTIIRWACQLLEALTYLHSRPPYGILHGDIKPANIMLRENGDICLIDYNIALALGEDGAVKTGFSRGYASPEHYEAEYESQNRHAKRRADVTEREDSTEIPRLKKEENTERKDLDEATIIENRENTERTSSKQTSSRLMSNSNKMTYSGQAVMLDVRSDIYSLGATLYHLLSGRRPAQDARKVESLGPDVCSPAVARIIEKAMEPDPSMRYQSAREMLTAFRRLHTKDPRVIRHRRRIIATAAALSVSFLCGGTGTFVGLKRMDQTKEALALSEYSANRLADGDVAGAVRLALQAVPKREDLLTPPVTPQARKALTDALGVYDLADGYKSLGTIELPSAPFTIALSPQGTWFAAVYQYELAVFDTETRQKRAVLPIEKSALSEAVFADEKVLVYGGEEGLTAFDLTAGEILWTGEQATTLAVSGDGKVAAGVNRDNDHAVLYRISDGTRLSECSFEGQHMEVPVNDSFANPGNRIFCLNETGDLLAVSFQGGGLWIFDIDSPDDSMIVYEESSYRHFEGGFCGDYFAFGANKSDQSQFGLIDTVEGTYVGSMESRDHFLVKTDRDGICLANGNLLVRFDRDTLGETELAYTGDVKITGFDVGDGDVLAATEGPGFSFYDRGAHVLSEEPCEEPCDFLALGGGYGVMADRNGPTVRFMKRESHEEAQMMSYDARYTHDEARLNGDGNSVMLFDYEKFRICDPEGEILAEGEFPEAEQIYDQQFRRSQEESFLEVIWYDGTVRRYSASDGSVLWEEKRDPPDEDLYEEFQTDRYRIASPLHGAPVVYDLESGRQVKTLEADGYLTYVTQAEEYVITEYVSAQGERYGLLLDEKLETIACLPRLCDYADGKLIFDYGSGNLRQCRLYSLQELMALGETYLQQEGGNLEKEG